MNSVHWSLCKSAYERRHIGKQSLPSAPVGVHLAYNALEVGPGPWLPTNLLSKGVERLICPEIDAHLARSTAKKMRGTNVRVMHGDTAFRVLTNDCFQEGPASRCYFTSVQQRWRTDCSSRYTESYGWGNLCRQRQRPGLIFCATSYAQQDSRQWTARH